MEIDQIRTCDSSNNNNNAQDGPARLPQGQINSNNKQEYDFAKIDQWIHDQEEKDRKRRANRFIGKSIRHTSPSYRREEGCMI